MPSTARTVLLAVAISTSAVATAQGRPEGTMSDSRWSFGAEALLVWFKSSPTPVPIITDNYANLAGTNVLLGGGSVDTNPNAGLRITGAYRVDSNWGVELTGIYVPSRSTSSSVSSSGQAGSTDLLLPFIDAVGGHEDYTQVSSSPDFAGAAQAKLENNLGGFELNSTWALPAQGGWSTTLIGGLRFLQLRESYTITTSSPNIPPNPADVWNTNDAFNARNRFYGVQGGARAQYDEGPWTATLMGKLALGSMQQRVSVNGFLETNDFNGYGTPQQYTGGYFALGSNMGDHSRNTFAVLPEIGVNLGYRLNTQATVYIGYSFLYASSVVRPGEQINRNVNTSQGLAYGGEPPARLVGSAEPSFSFHTTDFWAQSLALGFSYRF